MNSSRFPAKRRGRQFRSQPSSNNSQGNSRGGNRRQGSAAHQAPAEPAARKPLELMEPVQSFIDSKNVFADLIPEIQHALNDSDYHTPTPVQADCIPHLLKGLDLLGSAQTGTGKTAAFTLPLLQKLAGSSHHAQSRKPRVLILAPTRELAAQIGDSIKTYGEYLQISHTVIFGGVGQFAQEKAMNRGVDILVATPGRLLDLMGQGFVKLDAVETFVLDEADRMLDMGFIHDVKKVIAELPAKRQSLFFSATIAPSIVSLANSILTDAVRVTIAPDKPTVDKIDQKVMFVDKGRKDSLLTTILSDPAMDKVIVFVQRKRIANQVTDKLMAAGIRSAVIHGNKSQNARTAALEDFRKGKVKALVATDIAARGIDVDGITHVINYELPVEPESYVHRIGRTARAGTRGDAVSFCMASERSQLHAIERLIRKPIPVDRDHYNHSDAAEYATGADARPLPRGGRGGGGRGPRKNINSPRDYAVSSGGGRGNQNSGNRRAPSAAGRGQRRSRGRTFGR